MLVHAHRHLPYTQRPHTRCLPNTRSLTHPPCLTHTHHTTHTRGGTHPRCLTHTDPFTHTRGSTNTRCFAHACRFWRTRGLFRLRCPFHTRRAGKHALRHTRKHTTHTRGLFHTRGFFYTRGPTHTRGLFHTWVFIHTRGRSHTRPCTPAMRASQHAFCYAGKHTPRHHTHRDNHTEDSCPHKGSRAFIPPKLRVHPFAALIPSTSQGTTELTWSRSASRGHSVSLRSRRRPSSCPHWVPTRCASSPPLSSTTCVCVLLL